jgi:TolB-like protein
MADGGGEEQATSAPLGTPDVFMSYASQDAAVANATLEALEKQGIKCWIAPRDVTPGAHYADSIILAISGAKALVLVLSDSALQSKHVGKEIERASSKGRPIIALRMGTSPLPPAFEYFLSESQWIDVGIGGVPSVAAKLVEAVRSHISPSGAGEPQVRSGPSIASRGLAARRLQWMLAAGVAILFLVLAYFAVDRFSLGRSTAQHSPVSAIASETNHAAQAVPEKSVAVLPFLDMSEKQDEGYFSDGLSEELIDMLTRVPELRIPARTSSFYFKGKQATIRDIAAALGVAHVLEGSVRKSGKTLRVTAQLIRVDNGYHLWSETYDRKLDDIFKIQDDIAAAVVKALKLALTGDSVTRPIGTRNADALSLYLQGQAIYRLATTPKEVDLAADYIRRSLVADPNFAAAWAVRSTILTDQSHLPEDRRAAEQAIKLDPRLPDGHAI